jgi:hypothetical protein
MKNIFLIIALSSVAPAHADLSGAEPQDLCALLNDFGLKTTEFVAPGQGERPLCYTASEPTRIKESGYEYSYRVLSHWEWDIVEGLFLQLQGDPAKVLGKEPQAKFLRMSDRILSEVLDEPERQQVLLALEALAPGEHRHALVQGLNIQIRYVDYSVHGLDPGVEFRLDVGNVCNYSPLDARGRKDCIEKHSELRWSPSRF